MERINKTISYIYSIFFGIQETKELSKDEERYLSVETETNFLKRPLETENPMRKRRRSL